MAAHDVADLPPEAHVAGLRTRLVSRLTGLSVRRLQHWHESELLEAQLRVGRRGVPRLYSWVDYLRLQVAAELEKTVPTRRIRKAVEFLDKSRPDWYLLPDRIRADMKGHVRAEIVEDEPPLLADMFGQHTFNWPDDLDDVAKPTQRALAQIARRGSLGRLYGFNDAVFMSPRVNLGQPSVRRTALETRFVAGMADETGIENVVTMYGIKKRVVGRAISFEEAVA